MLYFGINDVTSNSVVKTDETLTDNGRDNNMNRRTTRTLIVLATHEVASAAVKTLTKSH